MTETDKVKIDFTQLRGFAELARRNGTEDAFIDLALDFALQACAEVERLTTLLEDIAEQTAATWISDRIKDELGK